MQAQLEARRLAKYCAAIPAIRDVSFVVPPGTVVGLLGPNGSGKSTTVWLMTGLREPSAGEIWFAGRNIVNINIQNIALDIIAAIPKVWIK